jgi:prepilin-type N-terminal cleavage/methylation domain-containing protein/prepilin-type processing-associated H-X9-DG protein
MRSKKAFTLIELLVVIAVIALLLSILIPALQKARDQALRVKCGENIRQHILALMIYADEHNGRIPVQHGGYWIWDVSFEAANIQLKNMGIDVSKYELQPGEDVPVQPVFYCPANPMHRKYMESNWSFAINTSTTPPTGYRVTGYIFLWWGDNWSGAGIDYTNDEPAKSFLRRIDIKQPATVELVLDTTLSDIRPSVWPADEYPDGNFAQITCGGNPGYGYPDSSSHVQTERKPLGGNVGFADGHLEWRPFNEMKKRFPPGNLCPVFWW